MFLKTMLSYLAKVIPISHLLLSLAELQHEVNITSHSALSFSSSVSDVGLQSPLNDFELCSTPFKQQGLVDTRLAEKL